MIFVISVLATYIYEAKLFKEENQIYMINRNGVIAFLVITILFVVFTFITPELGIFLDPTTNTYGM